MTIAKQVGAVSCESDVLKMSVITSASRLACVLSIQPAKLSGSALLIFTPSRLFLTSAADTYSGWSSGGRVDFTADSLLRR